MPNAPGWLIGLAARAHPRLRQRLDRSAAALRSDLPRRDLERWRDVTMPSTVEFVEGWYDTDLSSAGTEAVRAALKASVQQLSSVVTANFETDFAHLIPVAQFLGRVESSHGIAAAEALALVQRCSRRDSLLPAALAGLAADLSRSDRVLARLRDVSTRSLDEAVAGDSGAESALARHRRRWGFTLLSYDLEGPTIREAPEFELRALAAYLGAPRVLDRPAADPGALSADERRLLRAAGEWFHVREEGEAVKALLLGLIRTLALELGRRSAAGTARPQGELALHATLAELLSVAGPLSDEQRRMLLRRERERRVAARRAPPPLLGPKPRRSPSTAWLPAASRDIHRAAAALASNDMLPGVESAESTLVGLGVSSGTHSGRVRIVRSIPDFSAIERDDVVVTTITSSPLMAAVPNIGALVTESGGALSHVAIVARAMDIPAVVSVAAATRILVDGEPVTVNGTAGTIRRTTLLDKNVPS